MSLSTTSPPKSMETEDNKTIALTKTDEIYPNGTTVIVSNYHQKMDGNKNHQVDVIKTDPNNNEEFGDSRRLTHEQQVSSTTASIDYDYNNNNNNNNNNNKSPPSQSKQIQDFKISQPRGLVKREVVSPLDEDELIKHHFNYGEPPPLNFSSTNNNNNGAPVINSTDKFVRNSFLSFNHRMPNSSYLPPCYNPFISNQGFPGLQSPSLQLENNAGMV